MGIIKTKTYSYEDFDEYPNFYSILLSGNKYLPIYGHFDTEYNCFIYKKIFNQVIQQDNIYQCKLEELAKPEDELYYQFVDEKVFYKVLEVLSTTD